MKKLLLFIVITFVSTISFGQGLETFTNSPLGNNYATGSYSGDNGVMWNYISCKEGVTDTHSTSTTFPGIMLSEEINGGAINALSGANGVGEITMKLFKGVAGTTQLQVDLYVNEVHIATSVGFNDAAEHIFTVTGINVTGNVKIEVKNTKSEQIKIDDLEWTASGQTLSVVKNQIENFAMYPNPVSNGKLYMSSSTSLNKNVAIYALTGQQVYSKNIQTQEPLDISNLNRGIYIVRIEEEGKIATRKLVVD